MICRLITACFIGIVVCSNAIAQSVGIKVDRVTVNSVSETTGGWVSVSFPTPFGSVPVVIVSPTDSNPDPATVRIRNITTSGFEALVVEPSASDATTSAMTIDYFAAEEGVYTFPGAVRFEVGSHSTDTFQGREVGGASWDSLSFNTSFTNPAVVTQIQTINSQPNLDVGISAVPWLEVAMGSVSNSGMQIALERAETSDGTLIAETIGYMVMSSGDDFSLGGETVQALRSSNNVRGWANGCFSTSFNSAFSATPLAVASQMTRAGSDGGWARRCTLSNSSIGLTIDEDVNSDTDRAHTSETVGVLATSGPFSGSRNGRDIASGQFTVQAGSTASDWTSVVFDPAFDVTPFVFALNRGTEAAPSELRLRNVTTTGFDIALVKPNGETNAAIETIVDYVAATQGEYTMGNGDIFEIGSVTTSAAQGLSGNGGWETITFNSSFSAAPALITQVQTNANEPALNPSTPSVPWVAVTARNLSSSGVELALETAQTQVGSVSSPETIAYFATQNGANGEIESESGDMIDYEMYLTADNIRGWGDGCFVSSFADSYSNPIVVASQTRRDGSDGGWARRCSLSSNSVGLNIDEDRDRDSERNHTTEQAAVFVFEGPFQGSLFATEHYAISHGLSAVTCEAEQITITPHTSAHGIVPASGERIRISANSSSGGWASSDVSWLLASGSGTVIGSGAGYIDYEFSVGESFVQLWLSNSSEADIDIDVINIDNTNVSDLDDGGSEDQLLTFRDSGFRFYADSGASSPIPSPITAGDINGPLYLRGVETDTESGACVARISGAQTVSMAYECVNPGSCFRDGDAQISGVAISANDSGNIVSYQDVPLTFDGSGLAPFTLQYLDAGQFRLHASLSLPASGNEAAFNLTGSSSTTTSKPADLFITSIEAADGTVNPGSTSSGNGFVPAGSPFTVEIEARGSTGVNTPNFSLATSGDLIQLNIDSLVLPSSGVAGSLNNATSFVDEGQGRYSNSSVSWNNVGAIRINANLSDGDYLGGGDVTGSTSATIGRFYPQTFSLESSAVENGCAAGDYTYMSGQSASYRPISIQHEVRALTATGDIASNYTADYPVTSFRYVAENDNNGIDLGARLSVDDATWEDGVYELDTSENSAFRRNLSTGSEIVDGPFDNLRLSIMPDSSSNLDPSDFSSSDLDSNASTAGDCVADGNCDSVSLGTSINAIFGRLFGQNAHGPETSALPVTLEVQWWNGSEFEINSGDSCTEIGAAASSFDGAALDVDANRTVSIGAASTTGNFSIYSPGSFFGFDSGSSGLVFTAPGAGNTGRFNIEIDLTDYPWLRFDWDQNGDQSNDIALPAIEVSYGSYRGHDRVIYWREVFSN